MESRAKLFGHPIHPMLIVLPLGLFVMAAISDIGYMSTHSAGLATVSYWDIAGGILGGLLAAVFGTMTGGRSRPGRAPRRSACITASAT